ncbi:MAG: P1 family peptidase [Chloroflexi bacterium]|nr:P1 family peptidase [Chloroflexota bacterium]
MSALTDVAGLLVGHAHDLDALTGVTVVLCPAGAVAGVDVRGGAPGTRETDLLRPETLVERVHAVALCGGSAFGLAAGTGVVAHLSRRGIGFPTAARPVPIVPAAVIYDLGLGRGDAFPDAAMGEAACAVAGTVVAEGCVGAGTGASVGKLLGSDQATKGGVGTAAERLPDGVVGALVVCNALGDVVDPATGRIIAGARWPEDPGLELAALAAGTVGPFAGAERLLRRGRPTPALGTNTTVAVVATSAALDKAGCTRLAMMAQAGLARAIRPAHTPFDGDTVFALATGDGPTAAPAELLRLGAVAADVLAAAVVRGILAATALGGLPAARDLAS